MFKEKVFDIIKEMNLSFEDNEDDTIDVNDNNGLYLLSIDVVNPSVTSWTKFDEKSDMEYYLAEYGYDSPDTLINCYQYVKERSRLANKFYDKIYEDLEDEL